MKKSLLILSSILITISLSAFAFNSWKKTEAPKTEKTNTINASNSVDFLSTLPKTTQSDLIYNIDTRFKHSISLHNFKKAKSILEIIPEGASDELIDFQNNRLTLIEDKEIIEWGSGLNFTETQIELMNTVDYSANLYIESYCKRKNEYSDNATPYKLVYFMTITPEKQAEYIGGNDKFLNLLRTKTKKAVAHIEDEKLKPCRIHFTINKEGILINPNLERTSGYKEIDELLIELLIQENKNWNSAQSANGEKVSQELVFFFGKEGC